MHKCYHNIRVSLLTSPPAALSVIPQAPDEQLDAKSVQVFDIVTSLWLYQIFTLSEFFVYIFFLFSFSP